jgi:hypothetical protein
MSFNQVAYKAAALIRFDDNGSDTIDSACGDHGPSSQHGIGRFNLLSAQVAKTAELVLCQR